MGLILSDDLIGFLLTRPSRGVTSHDATTDGDNTISTHTPLAGRDSFGSTFPLLSRISTHTPLAGRDAAGTA